MYSLNRAQIIGHLTQDPEVRQTPSGQTVGDLNIMVRHVFSNASGQPQASTSYHTVVVWRGLADICGRFLKKGSQVYISGRIQTDEWEDASSGQKRYKTRIVADDLILLDSKNAVSIPTEAALLIGGLNQTEVIGNVTRDPELRQTASGESVVSFGLATNYAWKNRMGEEQEKTEFHNVVAWSGLAQSIQKAWRKGRKVYVAGRLQTRSWETADGSKRYTTEIIAEKALTLGVPDAELGPPAGRSEVSVSFSKPAPVTTTPVPSSSFVPPNPVQVPEIHYESEIKPEDLPF